MEKFPAEGRVFKTPTGDWAAKVVNDPEPGSSSSPFRDMVLFEIEFNRTDSAVPNARRLRLWTSQGKLCNEREYPLLLFDRVLKWLSMCQDISGEIWYLGK